MYNRSNSTIRVIGYSFEVPPKSRNRSGCLVYVMQMLKSGGCGIENGLRTHYTKRSIYLQPVEKRPIMLLKNVTTAGL